MRPRTRDITIDLLRGWGTVIIILIHIAPYFPRVAWYQGLMSWGQFVVPLLVYCSIAVTRELEDWSVVGYVSYIGKRLKRLLIPYYAFVAIYLTISSITGQQISSKYLFQTITLTGGLDFGWLVLLYIVFALVVPFLVRWHRLAPRLFWTILGGCSVISVIYFLNPYALVGSGKLFDTGRLYRDYRILMIPTWILCTQLCILIKDTVVRKSRAVWMIIGVSTVISILTYLLLTAYGASLHMRSHKYPPDIMYLSYSLVWVGILAVVTPTLARYLPLQKLTLWTSTYSYSLFFIHLVVLHILQRLIPADTTSWYVFTLLVLVTTYAAAWIAHLVTYLCDPQMSKHSHTRSPLK